MWGDRGAVPGRRPWRAFPGVCSLRQTFVLRCRNWRFGLQSSRGVAKAASSIPHPQTYCLANPGPIASAIGASERIFGVLEQMLGANQQVRWGGRGDQRTVNENTSGGAAMIMLSDVATSVEAADAEHTRWSDDTERKLCEQACKSWLVLLRPRQEAGTGELTRRRR